MKAMVLAAGFGTRLRPLTASRPKALINVSDRTLLQITFERLRSCNIDEVIINVHHKADMILSYLQENENFGIRIEVSYEENLLDTGGGLKKAAWFFLEDPNRLDEPFIVHNVDVISTIDLCGMLEFHRNKNALATLAVQKRDASRYLVFGDELQLCGVRSGDDGEMEMVQESKQLLALAFCGIHVISPRLLHQIPDRGKFSIIDAYLDLAARGLPICGYRADDYSWRDVGTLENLKRALENSGIS